MLCQHGRFILDCWDCNNQNKADEITQLRARVLELEKERDAAREEAGARRQDLADFTRIVSKTVDDLKQEIAAQQLVIQQMREALQILDRASNVSCGKVQEALALQPSTEALDAYVAEAVKAEREACAAECVASKLIELPIKIEIAAVRKCAAAIRARSDRG